MDLVTVVMSGESGRFNHDCILREMLKSCGSCHTLNVCLLFLFVTACSNTTEVHSGCGSVYCITLSATVDVMQWCQRYLVVQSGAVV